MFSAQVLRRPSSLLGRHLPVRPIVLSFRQSTVERRGRRNGTSAESIQQEVGTLGKVTAIPEEPVVFASPSSVDFDCLQVLRLSFAHDARCVLRGHSNDLDTRV